MKQPLKQHLPKKASSPSLLTSQHPLQRSGSAVLFVRSSRTSATPSRLSATTSSKAFTIVELLIVVVVIAILAAITIVSYNGISNRAKESALKSDLNTTAKKVGVVNVETGSYPATKPPGLSDTIQYSQTNSGQGFCATAAKDNMAFNITQSGSIQEGACSGHTTGGGGNEIVANSPIQNVTSAQCQALPEFTGSNTSAIRTVTDNRGGTTRTYEIAKLADGKCWMLDNLKLGSTTDTITLTPSDSDVSSNFTLPQVQTGGGTSFDTPTVSGPVPGATNYGYLYNWPAATAGESRTTMPAGSGNAPNSICAAGWRLPTGDTTGEFAWLNARMNNPSASAPSTSSGSGFYQNWQNTGPFKGVFSGNWYGSFSYQGSNGCFWSSSAHAGFAVNAHDAYFLATSINPGNSDYRNSGFGVRCLLN